MTLSRIRWSSERIWSRSISICLKAAVELLVSPLKMEVNVTWLKKKTFWDHIGVEEIMIVEERGHAQQPNGAWESTDVKRLLMEERKLPMRNVRLSVWENTNWWPTANPVVMVEDSRPIRSIIKKWALSRSATSFVKASIHASGLIISRFPHKMADTSATQRKLDAR